MKVPLFNRSIAVRRTFYQWWHQPFAETQGDGGIRTYERCAEAGIGGDAISYPLLIGGTSLLLGVKPKVGAVALLGFLAGVSPVIHDFWHNEKPEERNTNMIMFMRILPSRVDRWP